MLAGCDAGGPGLNDVSRYAKRCHDLLYADAAASAYFTHSDEHSPQTLYDMADRLSKDAGAMAIDIGAPEGFSESGGAWENYAQSVSDAYRKIANALNDPTLANSRDMVEAIHESSGYAAKAIAAFKRDLANSPFTKQEKNRILNRLM